MAGYSATFQADPTGYDARFLYNFGRLTLAEVGFPTDDHRNYVSDRRDNGTDEERQRLAETRQHASTVLGHFRSRDQAEQALRQHYDNPDIWLWDEAS